MTGEPVFPKQFTWSAREFAVDEVVEKWKQSEPCRNGLAERYLRNYRYRVKTKDNEEIQDLLRAFSLDHAGKGSNAGGSILLSGPDRLAPSRQCVSIAEIS